MTGDWIFLVALWVLTAAIVGTGVVPMTDQQLVKWSVRFNVLVDDQPARQWLATRLRRARVIRRCAFAIGLNVGLLPMYMNVIDVERAGDFSNALTSQAPYAAPALGAVLAELSLARAPRGKRAARITTRRWSDYVEGFWLAFVGGAALVATTAALVPAPDATYDLGWRWAYPAASCVAAVATTLGVHIVVNRRANAFSDETLRLDDALRADGAHHVVGASVALAGIAACSSLNVALGPGLWSGFLLLAIPLLLGNWYGIACTSRWNVDQAHLQHA